MPQLLFFMAGEGFVQRFIDSYRKASDSHLWLLLSCVCLHKKCRDTTPCGFASPLGLTKVIQSNQALFVAKGSEIFS